LKVNDVILNNLVVLVRMQTSHDKAQTTAFFSTLPFFLFSLLSRSFVLLSLKRTLNLT